MIDNPESASREYRKSTHSGADENCVEVARPSSSRVRLRDSKSPHDGTIEISTGAFAVFVARLKRDGFSN